MLLSKNKKKRDLISVLAELTGEVKSPKLDEDSPRTDAVTAQIRSVNIVVEIPKLDELVRELRELREAVREFVNLVKARLEAQEESEQNTQSQ